MHSTKGINKNIGDFSYNLGVVLGEGFSAKVYLGHENHTRRPVAVKVIEQSRIDNQVLSTLLRNELECHKVLNHENILKIYDQLTSASRIYMISQFCQKGTLFQFIVKQDSFNERMALQFLFQIMKAVNYIHSQGIIHRDIKSANILIKENNVLKLADFGFATFIHQPSQCTYNVGSPAYMSPQANSFNQYSFKSDVWAVGIIFYEMLVGYQPFYSYNWSDIIALITSGRIFESLTHASKFSRQLLARMLEFDPKNRATTEDILQNLQDFLNPQIVRRNSQHYGMVAMSSRSIRLN